MNVLTLVFLTFLQLWFLVSDFLSGVGLSNRLLVPRTTALCTPNDVLMNAIVSSIWKESEGKSNHNCTMRFVKVKLNSKGMYRYVSKREEKIYAAVKKIQGTDFVTNRN